MYQLYPKAVQDLESIYEYSLKKFGRKVADDYIRSLQKSFESLVDNLNIARPCDGIRLGLKALVVKTHMIFFEINKENILIIRVLHQSMDFWRHLA